MTAGVEPAGGAFRRQIPNLARGAAVLAVIVAVAGVVVATYLAIENAQGQSGVCVGVHGCQTVQQSKYGKILGVPISFPGLAAYITLVGLSLAWLLQWPVARAVAAPLGFLVAFGGALFSAYLTSLEAWVINAWCIYCITSAILMATLFLLWTGILLATRSTDLQSAG